MLLQLVVHFPDARVGEDLIALCINLALHPRAAELMVVCQLNGESFREFFRGARLSFVETLLILISKDPIVKHCLLCGASRRVSIYWTNTVIY